MHDLCTVIPVMSLGGAIVFDDIAHPKHPYLLAAWRLATMLDKGLSTYEYRGLGYGVAFAVRTREVEEWTARRC